VSQLLIRPAAAEDIEEAYLWYEAQRTGLGEEFLVAVHNALDSIAALPTGYPVVHREARRVLLHRFPYALYFRICGETIIVIACMHGRRNPRRWKGRS